MQQILIPLTGAVAGGGTAMLMSGNVPVAIGTATGIGVGVWLAQQKQRPPAA